MTTNTWGKMTTMTTQKNSTSTRSAKTEAEVSLDFVLLTIYFDTVSDSIDPLLLKIELSVTLSSFSVSAPGGKGGRGRGRGKGGRGMIRGGRGRNRGRGRGDMGMDDDNNGDMDNGVRLCETI